jgi:hypothetical protein
MATKRKTPKPKFYKEFYKDTEQFKVKMGDLQDTYRTVSLKRSDSERAMKEAALDYADAQNIIKAIEEQMTKLRTSGEMYL